MLDPRIYRAGLVAVALVLVVCAFSLHNQQGSLGATLAPDAVNGQNAYTDMTNLAGHYRHRRAGTTNDTAIAAEVAQRLGKSDGFAVNVQSFSAATPDGRRTLQNVIGVRAGVQSGTVVVIAHRDAVGSPAEAELSGTGVLLDLGRVLSGETLHRTIALVSTSGSTGAAGAAQLIHALPGPIDAVLVLGDLASANVREPVVVPWSDSALVAPPLYRNTVAAALSAQAGLRAGGTSLAGQFLHLAFPMTVSEQAPFGASGIPAVLLSASGERGPAASAPTSAPQITRFGRTALEVISALDSGSEVPAPSSYVILGGNVVPAWAIRLLVLGLILPVLGATIDGFARARRRGHPVGPWVAWVLEGAAPFVLALAVVLGAKAAGVLDVAPPSAAAAGAIPLHARGAVLLAVLALVIAGSFWVLRRLLPVRATRVSEPSANPGAAAALLVVMCVVTLAIWVSNPFAAALLLPALHLWMWVVAPDARMHPGFRLGLLLVGLAPFALAAAYYMVTLGYGPVDFAWTLVLMVAGGQLGVFAVLVWSVVLGCAVSVGTIGAWTMRRERQLGDAAVTVRGPVTYAGPGSLGGTESALRR
jgi:hypothetical protein